MRQIIKDHPFLLGKSFKSGQLRVNPVKLELKERNQKPRVSKLNPLSKKELDQVKASISQALKDGIIEESSSTE